MRRLLLALLVPGCVVHEQAVNLDELGPVRMLIGAQPASIYVEIESSAHPCPIIAKDFTATLRGDATELPIPMLTIGGEAPGTDTGECTPIKMRLERPPAIDPAELVLADSSLEVAIDLGGLLAAPSAALVPAGPWELASNHAYWVELGQRAVMAHAFSTKVEIQRVGEDPLVLPSRIDGDKVWFTTPTLPTTGQATLVVQVSGPQFTDWDCSPIAPGCDLVIDRKPVEVGVTFVP